MAKIPITGPDCASETVEVCEAVDWSGMDYYETSSSVEDHSVVSLCTVRYPDEFAVDFLVTVSHPSVEVVCE